MEELFEKSIRTLELPRVLELLSRCAASKEGRARCAALRPRIEADEVRRLQEETDAARTLIGFAGSPPFAGLKNVDDAVARAGRGGALNTGELLDVAGLLRSARRVNDYRNADSNRVTEIDSMFASLRPLRALEERITRAIPEENEISDSASAELGDIRRHMRAAGAKSRQILQRIVSSQSYAKALQENLITQRDGRFVVPVKAEYRAEIPGLVHDVSASGATLFVEPMGVVQANNELKELEAKEKKEIERILLALSQAVSAEEETIRWNYDILIQLDLIFARGEFSYQLNGIRPEIRTDGFFRLRAARHPLLEREHAVPIDVELGGEFDTLVITGPNTGGKTVTLKTIGLLTLMAQCGLQLPTDSGSCISVCSAVLADIGDEQSIEQSLSTFSSHMVNIVKILDRAQAHTLVLFDELGGGTDPVEGAALAIAIIGTARDRGARIAATTHYAELKTFAMTTPGVENASCEFDVETLQPTYRLLIGIPGKSNAFAISKRLGLGMEVIDRARAQMNSDSVQMEEVLTRLEKQRQELEKEKTETAKLRRSAEEDAKKAREYRDQIERTRTNVRAAAEAEARRTLAAAREQAEQVFAELNRMRKESRHQENWQQVNNARAEMMHGLNEAEAKLHRAQESEPIPKPSRPIRVGDSVELPGVRTPATVEAIQPDGTLRLQAGMIKMSAKAGEVRLLEGNAKPKKAAPASRRTVLPPQMAVSAELDIRGMMTDEGVAVVDRFLDNAVLGRLTQVTIIHGKGTGALRKAVHQELKKHPYVKSYRLGLFGEGEDGVTVVEMK